jgi:DNA-binding transcriptional ArsR family regulator
MVEHAPRLDAVFHALADPTRRAMVRRLARGERTVTELSEPFDMSLAAASKHVKVLERAGLVRRTILGRTHRCRLEPGPLADAGAWLDAMEGFWTERLDDLERVLRETNDKPAGGKPDDTP